MFPLNCETLDAPNSWEKFWMSQTSSIVNASVSLLPLSLFFSFRQRETKKVEKKDTKYSESQFLTGVVMSIQEKKKKQIVIKTELDTYTLKEFEGFRIQDSGVLLHGWILQNLLSEVFRPTVYSHFPLLYSQWKSVESWNIPWIANSPPLLKEMHILRK